MRRFLVAAALAAVSAANLVLLAAFLDATAQVRNLSRERADHRCPAVPLVHESRPSAAFFKPTVEPAPVRDPALIRAEVSGRG